MKKMITFFLTAALAFSAFAAPCYADEQYTGDDVVSEYITNGNDPQTFDSFEYTVNEDGSTVTITHYNGEEAEVIIPEEIDSKKVTAIGEKAFYKNNTLSAVTLPEGLVSINYYGFAYCEALTQVNFPEGLQSIGESAFRSCTSLPSVQLPKSLNYFDDNAFIRCSALESYSIPEDNETYTVTDGVLFNKDMSVLVSFPCGKGGEYVIPDGVKSIGVSAFEDAEKVESITFSNSVTLISEDAFKGCRGIKSIAFSDSIEEIQKSSFSSCQALESILLPESVTVIGDLAFSHDHALIGEVKISKNVTSIGRAAFMGTPIEKFTVEAENEYYTSDENGVLFNKDMTRLEEAPGGLSGSYVIPDTVERVGHNAFTLCDKLESVVIPDSVTILGDVVFADCKSLKEVSLGKNVKSIGSSGFARCYNLAEIKLPENLQYIGARAISYCTLLKEIEIPAKVTELPKDCFTGCTHLEKAVIYSGVTSIDNTAFTDCKNLTIYGYTGSYAEQYAQAMSIPFVSIGEADDTDSDTQTDIEPEEILSGDVNQDGKVNLRDASFTLKCVLHGTPFSEKAALAADVDSDKTVTATDSLLIQRYDIGFESYDIGKTISVT